MSTPGFSIPAAAATAATSRTTEYRGGDGAGRGGHELSKGERLMLQSVYKWAVHKKCSGHFTKLTLAGTIDGNFGEWVWRSPRGAFIKLTSPMGHRSSLITCGQSGGDEVLSGAWNRVLEGWNDASFGPTASRGWLFVEFGISVPKPLLQIQQQRLRIALRAIRRRIPHVR